MAKHKLNLSLLLRNYIKLFIFIDKVDNECNSFYFYCLGCEIVKGEWFAIILTQILSSLLVIMSSQWWDISCVEKRKISYFGLALNLFWHLISSNQDDLSYSARTFISGLQNGWAAKPSFFGLRRRPGQTFLWPSLLSDAFLLEKPPSVDISLWF